VVHRFPTGGNRLNGELFWDAIRLFEEIKRAIGLASQKVELSGIAVDTWGVDFGLLGRGDTLLGNPYHYRDSQTNGILEVAFGKVPGREIFQRTGSQIMQINTLYQLLSMVKRKSPLVEVADTMLMMPNLFSYWLSGVKGAEFTIATTSQCFNPETGDWDWKLLDELGIPQRIFPKILKTGAVLGPVTAEVGEETGAAGVPVIATAAHDTAAAVAAVPATTDNYAFISSGTWSLTGVEVEKPVMSEAAFRAGVANEGCYGGTYRFLKNVMGLWLVQECKRTWAKEGEDLDYGTITQLAAEAKPFKCFINPDDALFLAPGDMPSRIREFCKSTGQAVPETKGEIVRAALESLALQYRVNFNRIEHVTGKHIDTVHIVGGGCQNRLLCQFTADATAKPVIAGPIEATAAGNVLVQAIATGAVASLAEARQIVRDSFELETFNPADTAAWDEAAARFGAIVEK
jgi:sugar (pentulose or hexulose) kinase